MFTASINHSTYLLPWLKTFAQYCMAQKKMLFSVDWWITIIAKKTWADNIENGIIEAIPLKTNFSLYLSLQGVNCFNIKYSICPSHNQHHTDNICLT